MKYWLYNEMGLSARPGSFHQLTLSFYKATHAVIHQSQRTIEFYTWKRGWHGRTAESECSIELDYVCSQAKGLDSKNKCHSLHYSRPGGQSQVYNPRVTQNERTFWAGPKPRRQGWDWRMGPGLRPWRTHGPVEGFAAAWSRPNLNTVDTLGLRALEVWNLRRFKERMDGKI